MKINNLTKLLFIGILGLLLAAGCAKNGSNGATGTAGQQGAQGTQGTTGPALPSVTWVMPIPGATGVYMDSVIKVGFSNPMISSTIDTSTFVVSTGGVNVTGTAFFSPNLPLNQFGSYTATLTTGIKDTAGNPITPAFTWTFEAGGSSTPSRLYVPDYSAEQITIFNNAGSATGNIVPDRIIGGGSFNGPQYMWLDKAADRIYMTNNDASNILVFNNANTIDGGAIVPDRTISSPGFSGPQGIWLDSSTDQIYMADAGASAVYIFSNASTLNGSVSPTRTLSGANTTFNLPVGVWLDTVHDELYVSNFDANAVLVFTDASTANGNVAPARTISGVNTNLNGPQGIWLDSTSDTLYAANSNGASILVFDNASKINGDIAPSRTISGSNTTLSFPTGVWVDASTDRLYIADEGAGTILVFNNASTVNGNVAPSRTIGGSNTTLSAPKTIWLDMNP
jgi:Bacterial Ig-like domain